MQYLFGIIIFLFGAALGSFINVIADRFNTGLSFMKGRSFCFSCNHILDRKDLFPLLSFLFLKGKCRYCGSKIPKESFFIEIIMGILSVIVALKLGVFYNFQFSTSIAVWQVFNFIILNFIFAVILLISIYDLRHFIIPNQFLAAFFVSSLSYKLLALSLHLAFIDLFSGILLAVPFLAIFIFSKGKWIGLGDVKYIAVIGFFLGVAEGLSAVIIAFWIGAIFSLLALSLRHLKPQINLPLIKNSLTIKSEIPFGPFLSLGIILSFYLNADLFQIKSLLNLF